MNFNLPDEEIIPHRVFMNQVDSFQAKYIAAYLTDQIYGASKLPGGGDEEMGEEDAKPNELPIASEKYEVTGTLKEEFHIKSEDILYVVNDQDDHDFISEVLKCGVIIFDITLDSEQIKKALMVLKAIESHLNKIKDIGPKTFQNYKVQRTFILISTIMTWGLSKPLDAEDPDIPFSEIDYRKRRAHPNYKTHLTCEREVIAKGKLFKDNLKTYVLGSGIIYGHAEQDLSFLFKMAWYNAKHLPIFLPGNNYVPLIHVEDLAKIVHRIIDNPPNKPQYILAVEQTATTLRQMVRAISKSIGSGLTKDIKAKEAFLYNEITQRDFDLCTVNLKMEPVFVVENLQIAWKTDLNFNENIKNIANEFRTARHLTPIKVIMLGPPASGKSKLANIICEKYGLHYVSDLPPSIGCWRTLERFMWATGGRNGIREKTVEQEGRALAFCI